MVPSGNPLLPWDERHCMPTQVLTLKDIPTIQQRLLPIKGVKRVGVNVAESVVYIEHDVSIISAHDVSRKLQHTCPNTVATDAQEEIVQRAATAMSVAPSKYVASTLSISNLTLGHIRLLEKTLASKLHSCTTTSLLSSRAVKNAQIGTRSTIVASQ